jgi:hypothetical protein
MRRAAKVDATQAAIVEALRAAGAIVVSLAALGGGCPDLLVWRDDRAWLLEVKSRNGRLTPAQERWLAAWRGPSVHVVRTPAEALAAVGVGT